MVVLWVRFLSQKKWLCINLIAKAVSWSMAWSWFESRSRSLLNWRKSQQVLERFPFLIRFYELSKLFAWSWSIPAPNMVFDFSNFVKRHLRMKGAKYAHLYWLITETNGQKCHQERISWQLQWGFVWCDTLYEFVVKRTFVQKWVKLEVASILTFPVMSKCNLSVLTFFS